MGWIAPSLPTFDIDEWLAKPHHERLKPLAQDWALNGVGTPYAVYLLYVVKLIGFVFAAAAVVATTPGVGGFGDISSWWADPVVYEKIVVFVLVWEILGLGCGSMPLTFRFLPPIGGVLYWLRPGTMRLAPWPDKVPLTSGTVRQVVDVLFYAGVLGSGGFLLSASAATSGTYLGVLNPVPVIVLLAFLGLIGLRDKAIFLAARPEQYATMLVIFCFPPDNLIFALKLVMLAIWWGAATSKLNRHFPFVVSVMISNSPLQRFDFIKRKLWVAYPEDCRPSGVSAFAAHAGTVAEYSVPLVLILARGGPVTTIAVVIMVLFHAHITSTFPLGVPLEWNLFVIYSLLVLFGHYASFGFSDFHSPLLGVILALLLVGLPVLGNLRPDLVSFLPAMRYYAGNWGTSIWLFRNDSPAAVVDGAASAAAPGNAEERLDEFLVKPAAIVPRQLERIYDSETADMLLYKGLAFRALHSHGRALTGLLPRAAGFIGSDGATARLSDYRIREGELVAGIALGWNFGEGHLHNGQLVSAIQERCSFAPGQVRVISLEGQPINDPRQKYQIFDAHDGLLEEGHVKVSDMTEMQPWLGGDGTIAVTVLGAAEARAASLA